MLSKMKVDTPEETARKMVIIGLAQSLMALIIIVIAWTIEEYVISLFSVLVLVCFGSSALTAHILRRAIQEDASIDT